jgi:hypothetical protein
MNESEKVRQVLESCYPDDCDAVGPSNLDDIVSSDAAFSAPSVGQQIPLLEILQMLAAAATFLRAGLQSN